MQLSNLFAKWGGAELKAEFNVDHQMINGQFIQMGCFLRVVPLYCS